MAIHNFSITIPDNAIFLDQNSANGITNACIDFCKEANFIHDNNIELKMLFLPAWALMSLIVYEILDHNDNEKIQKHRNKLITFSKTLLIFFFIYFFWKYSF